MLRQVRHTYSVITTNFELEPVIADYFSKYPANQYSDYQIVFKSADEWADGEYSYIIVFERNTKPGTISVDFHEFLKSYCVCNDLVAAMNPINGGPAKIGLGFTFGQPKKS